jgi:proteasome lid subunit RPN8/RPN11
MILLIEHLHKNKDLPDAELKKIIESNECEQELFEKAIRTARAMKLDVIGFYHSHPDHPSEPSVYDKEHALPFYSYVIVSVDKDKAQILTSWELTDDRIDFIQEGIKEVSN